MYNNTRNMYVHIYVDISSNVIYARIFYVLYIIYTKTTKLVESKAWNRHVKVFIYFTYIHYLHVERIEYAWWCIYTYVLIWDRILYIKISIQGADFGVQQYSTLNYTILRWCWWCTNIHLLYYHSICLFQFVL